MLNIAGSSDCIVVTSQSYSLSLKSKCFQGSDFEYRLCAFQYGALTWHHVWLLLIHVLI